MLAEREASRLALLAEREASKIDTAPPERWTHGQAHEDSTGARTPTKVASGVWTLRRANSIGDAELMAAERFRRDYVFGVEGVRDPLVGRCGAHDPHDAQIARSEAITRHREIADVIGRRMTSWLVALVVQDLTFVAMQALFMSGPAGGYIEMKGRMTTILILLSRMYAAIDKRARRRR